jgi:DNA-directed RNA polymerase sigma subunit (sigma70/sigma32)
MERTAHVLRKLNAREAKTIRMHFGMEDGWERTPEEVGRFFDVTRERIRQTEAKPLRKVRRPSRYRELKILSMIYGNEAQVRSGSVLPMSSELLNRPAVKV